MGVGRLSTDSHDTKNKIGTSLEVQSCKGLGFTPGRELRSHMSWGNQCPCAGTRYAHVSNEDSALMTNF